MDLPEAIWSESSTLWEMSCSFPEKRMFFASAMPAMAWQ